MSNTGTYKYDRESGKIIKISDRANIGDLWYKKYHINANDDMRAGYRSLEEKGKLNEVDDKEIQKEFL